MKPEERIIFAYDYDFFDDGQAKLLESLFPHIGMVKVGLRAIYSKHEDGTVAETVLDFAHAHGKKVFLDCKLHDIPNTMGDAVAAVSKRGYDMFNIHASAGRSGIRRSVEKKGTGILLGVTVLTSASCEETQEVYDNIPEPKVLQFAHMLADEGADGLVCSAQELPVLSEDEKAKKLLKVVPGIRPEWAAKNDQMRTMAPKEAVASGADYLVIGRPISRPPEDIGTPVEAVKKIVEELS